MSNIIKKTAVIHHITCFVKDAQKNVDFYDRVLGLRLVKKTVNFDAPEVFHLYFGYEKSNPGTITTFFTHELTRKGRLGGRIEGGQVGTTTYVVPMGALDFWKARLTAFDISFTESTRFSENSIAFLDPDGLQL